ncbi:MAG: GNAT family N-acetyltransferase [Nonomuraea sp.]|nr:GNAT family N-acetyltransferase [Nonomuraea sp.]
MAIVPAAAGDARRVAELIATAFAPLAATAYLVPEPERRVPVLAADFLILVEHALEHGVVDVDTGGHGAAVWFPMTGPLPAPRDYDVRLAEATGDCVERFRVLDELFEKNHPGEPHHHLAFLAVHPSRQNLGLGTALLDHHHARLGGMPAYLEASSTRSRDLYARHGYQLREPFALPDGTLFWPMWRPPRL